MTIHVKRVTAARYMVEADVSSDLGGDVVPHDRQVGLRHGRSARIVNIGNEKTFDSLPKTEYGIAAAVTFLVSPRASYITGQVLHVNGGMYMG